MNVRIDDITDESGSNIAGPYSAVGEEETLLGGESVFVGQRAFLHLILECEEGYVDTAVVSDVFAQCLFAVGFETGNHFFVGEPVDQYFGALVVVVFIFFAPPIVEIAGFVVLATLIVESMAVRC